MPIDSRSLRPIRLRLPK